MKKWEKILQNGAIRGLQIGTKGITNRGFKSGQKDYTSGQRNFKSGQERFQIGAGITNP